MSLTIVLTLTVAESVTRLANGMQSVNCCDNFCDSKGESRKAMYFGMRLKGLTTNDLLTSYIPLSQKKMSKGHCFEVSRDGAHLIFDLGFGPTELRGVAGGQFDDTNKLIEARRGLTRPGAHGTHCPL